MDIQKEVSIILNDIEKDNEIDLKEKIENTISKIKKTKKYKIIL